MNFIASSLELKNHGQAVSAYGNTYLSSDCRISNTDGDNEMRFRCLCFDKEGPRLSSFLSWSPGATALVTGHIVFSANVGEPLDLIITTLETNVPKTFYCNQVVLGNAFFKDGEFKERRNGTLAAKIGTTLDNSDVTSWLFMEIGKARKTKLEDRIRKGRPICVQGQLREYRKNGDENPYRAIVAQDFTTRRDRDGGAQKRASTGSAAGYGEDDLDPTPEY